MARGRRRKRGREPEVLRRAYGGRARTLQHTILSLPPRPPPTPAACLCRGRRCLACGGAAHLLRPDDPADYRALLTLSFCVVSPDAPPPPPADYLPQGSTQRSLVRNVLELMKANSQVHTNVLCNDYDQQRHFGTISESLCTSSWDLLLTRIGDALMVFLLKYSSIFTPFTRKIYHQVTGTPLDELIKSSKILCPTSISRNQQSWLGDHILHGYKMKRRRYKSEDTKLDAPFSILQPSSLLSADESTDFNSRSVVIGNCRKSVRECRSIDREPGFLRSHPCDSKTGNFVDKDNSNANYQDRLTTNPCHHPEDFSRPYSRDVTDAVMLEGKKFYCTLRDYKLESGEELMNASLLSSDLHEMHVEQVVSSNLLNTCDVIVTSGADNFRKSAAFKRESRKHARLFSWQRRKKRKLNPGIVLNNKTFTEDKDSPNVEIQHNFGIKHCHHHFDSTRPNKFGNITELYPSAYQNPVTIPKSITLEEYEAISRINVHSVHAEEMNQKHLDTSLENDQDCAKHLADNETEVEPHTDIGCSDTPCMHMKNTLQAVISDKWTTPATLQRKSTRAEFTSRNSCSSMKQKELHSHSDKMASWCFNCLMMQAPQKVVPRDHIKRPFIFYDRFLSASVFPRNHILNKLNPNDSGARYLMKHIFGIAGGQVNTCSPLCSRCSGYSSTNSECLYHSLLRLLKSLIRNAQRCWNRKLLRKHCLVSPSKQFCKDFTEPTSKLALKGRPSSKLSKKKDTGCQHSSNNMLADGSRILRTGNEKREHLDDKKSKVCLPLLEPSKAYCRHQQVTSFIWSVTRRIVPLDLLGDPTTWRTLRKNISKFVRLRRFEAFCLKQCCHGLKPSCFPFLSKIRLSDRNCKKFTNVTLSGKSTMKEPGSSFDDIRTLHNKVFQFWIYWFFSYIVVPMIGANFYVTENQSGRQDVFYYPKPVWRKLVGRAITNMSKQNYRHIDSASLRLIFKKRAFGFSKVRFLPNDNGLRPIANLRAPSKLRLPHNEYAASNKKAKLHGKLTNTNRKRKLVYRKPVNSCLHELHAVLRKIKIDYPQKLGSSVFDYNGIYQKLLQFLSKAKSGTNKRSQVFIVVADVSKAFDSIDQDMLIDIMQDILENDEYRLRRYAQVVCTKKSTNAVYSQVPYDKHTNKNNTTFGISGHFYSTSGILIDQGTNNKIKQKELHYLLWEHLKHNVVQFGRNFYLQKVGIPQGSLLSSLLCSYYYGHLERSIILPFLEKAVDQPNPDIRNNKEVANRCVCTSNVSMIGSVDDAFSEMDTLENGAYHGHSRITNLNEEQLRLSTSTHSCLTDHAAAGCTDDDKCETSSLPDHILLRFIDDFLFISTSQKEAASFFNRMRRGFSYYNCFMNNQKFGINFDMEQNSILVNRKYTGSDGISYLPWSGLLLNCQTLEVQADYTRYWGVHISSTITVPAQAKPVRHLRRKLCDYMRPKCHPIFYDSKINSPTTVSLNAYQAFLLCAMKFHCYVSSMPDITMQNPSYFLEIIEMSFSYMYKLIKKRMNDMRQSLNVNPTFNLKKAEIVWLGLSAYIRVLKKKQSRYKQLLSLLRCKFLIHGRTCNSSSHLKYTNDDSHSSMFWKIKF